MKTETITINPTWGFAVNLYIFVLEDPKASSKAKAEARTDLRTLAKNMDEIIAENKDKEAA